MTEISPTERGVSMHRLVSGDDVARLARSAEQILSLIKAIDVRSDDRAKSSDEAVGCATTLRPHPNGRVDDDALVRTVKDVVRLHRLAPDFGATDLFGNKAWLVMLELFVAGRTGAAMPVTHVCLSLGGSQSSGMRCVADMERRTLIRSALDAKDARRRLIFLTPASEDLICRYLEDWIRERTAEPRKLQKSLGTSRAQDGQSDRHRFDHDFDAKKAPHPVASESGTENVLQ